MNKRLFFFLFLDNIWKSEIDFILNRNDRLVILSFINTSPYQNDTNLSENHIDNSVESLDYDLNPFETHESMQSYNTPTEDIRAPHSGSSPVQISSWSEEDDYFLQDLTTTTTRRTTTYRSTSTTPFVRPTTTTTSTQSTTEEQIFTEPTTLPTTVTTTALPTTTETTPLPTTTTALPTTTTERATTVTTKAPAVLTNSPIVTEKVNHTGHRKGKKGKHNHKKHHKPHPPPILELDDLEQETPNQEFKIEDFDSFDHEIFRHESNRTNKKKNIPKSSQEQTRSTVRHSDSMERPRSTQRVMTDAPRPTAAKAAKTRSPNIVKPESFPALDVLSSTVTTNSKIIEIKPKLGQETEPKRNVKRSVDDEQFDESDEVLLLDNVMPSVNEDVYIIKEERGDIISPAALVGSIPNFTQTNELEGIGAFIQSLVGDNEKFDPKLWFQKSPSLEFVNLALALLVWSVRYPSVFWESSKAFSMIFSLQMIANSIDILMLHVGTSILFKLEIVGQFMTVQNQPSPLLLNGIVTLALTLLAYVLIISSSMILYLYGHSRLSAKIRDCQMITLKDGDIWSYFSHCASLCFFLALSVVKAPIIHDLSLTYRISLDGTIFAAGEFTASGRIVTAKF